MNIKEWIRDVLNATFRLNDGKAEDEGIILPATKKKPSTRKKNRSYKNLKKAA